MSEAQSAQAPAEEWRRFDYDNKAATAPPRDTLVWIMEIYYEGGVTIGWYDGHTMRTWDGSDDCKVTHWMPMDKPDWPDLAVEEAG
ncbi:hypothetical protein AB0392_48975 [Nonomuraea angiospora]|uniref:hypothetical protein n=1 Tax=Nonomuraea angiospora TaxID=46172 RepID=UPI00344C794F